MAEHSILQSGHIVSKIVRIGDGTILAHTPQIQLRSAVHQTPTLETIHGHSNNLQTGPLVPHEEADLARSSIMLLRLKINPVNFVPPEVSALLKSKTSLQKNLQ